MWWAIFVLFGLAAACAFNNWRRDEADDKPADAIILAFCAGVALAAFAAAVT